MEPTQIAAMLMARSQAQVAAVAAAKMMKMNHEAAMSLVEVVRESADALEDIAQAQVAGAGAAVDITV